MPLSSPPPPRSFKSPLRCSASSPGIEVDPFLKLGSSGDANNQGSQVLVSSNSRALTFLADRISRANLKTSILALSSADDLMKRSDLFAAQLGALFERFRPLPVDIIGKVGQPTASWLSCIGPSFHTLSLI
jgi:hypothetical protein